MTWPIEFEKVVALVDDGPAAGFDIRRAYDEHGNSLFGFALNGTGDRGLAEDCVQETFLRAWRSRERFRPERASERTWLFAIARNVVVDALRARARRPRPLTEDELGALTDPVTRHTDEVITDRLALLAGLAQLSSQHREVIVAVQWEGLSYDQLAERTGVPVGTLRTRMYYGLRMLREILKEEDHE